MTSLQLGRVGLWAADFDLVPMAAAQEGIARVEEMGFGTVWVPEAVLREAFSSCALLLSATKKMTIATGIANLHARTAQSMQAGWKTLSEAFPDRFLLGIGVSHAPMVQGVHKGNYDKPYSTMVEYLEAMDNGVFFSPQPSTPPRRVLAALGPKMLKLAAEKTDGAHPYFTPVEHTAFARETLGKEPLLAPEIAVVLNETPENAKDIANKFMSTYTKLPNYTNNLKRFGFTEDDITSHSDRLMDAIVARGSIDVIVSRIKEHLDAGADHVCVQVLTGKPGVLPMKQWEELAQAVTGL